MGKKTVRRRIFLSNTLMVVITLLLFFMLNFILIEAYSGYIEQEMRASAKEIMGEDEMEALIRDWLGQRDGFILLFLLDGILCIAVLVFISQLFTKNLSDHIMEPLNALSRAEERVRGGELTQEITYAGDMEFENVCGTFNDMQKHLLAEREKNRKYEKARTDMIAGISHDLRTPLTAIRGTIKGLLDGVASTPGQQDRFLETAYRRTGDMEVLLNQLFYLSRLETGNLPISLQTVDIAAFIRGYVEEKCELLESGKAQIAAETGDISVNVSVDPGQLCRIFDNLVENSIKYADVEPLRMKIALTKTGSGVCICFSDNGAGVAEEKLPYLFDEFYRGDESRSRKEGNGLGLYIVKYLAEAMGGSVRAGNEGGLAVSMTLPAAGMALHRDSYCTGKERFCDGREKKGFDCGR